MAYKLGEVYIEVQAKIGQLEKDLDRLTKKVEKDTQKVGDKIGGFAESSGGEMMLMFGKIGAALAAFSGALTFSKQVSKIARDADEIQNKFDVVFGNVRKEANKTAATFAESFGLARSTANELLSGTGDLLKGMGWDDKTALEMSIQVNQLAQDLVSFKNFSGGAKGASDALTYAMMGETERAKALGIVIRQNTTAFQDKIKATMEAKKITELQARAYVVLEEMIRSQNDAVGDAKRTWDSLANVERRVLEQRKEQQKLVGDELNQSYLSMIKYLIQITTNTGGASEAMSAFGVTLKTIITPLQIIITLVKALIGAPIAVFSGAFIMLRDVMVGISHDFIALTKGIVPLLFKPFKEFPKHIEDLGKRTWSLSQKGLEQSVRDGWKVMKDGSKMIYEDWAFTLNGIRKLWSDTKAEIGGSPIQLAVELANEQAKQDAEKLEKIKQAAADRIDTLTRYYDEVKFLDSNYYKYRVNLINDEANANEKALGKEFNRAVFINKKKKELADDYFAHINSQLEKFTASDGTNFFQFDADGQLIGKPSLPINWKIPMGLKGVESREKEPPFLGADEDIIGKWLDENEAAAESFNIFVNGMADAFGEMRIRVANDASALTNIFANMANAFIAQVQRMIAQWIAFQMLKVIFNTILPGSGAVASLASPATPALPDGVARLTNPEHVSARNVGTRVNNNESILKQLQILNLNSTPKKQEIDLAIDLQGNLAGDDIYLSGKKAEKLRSASRGASY